MMVQNLRCLSRVYTSEVTNKIKSAAVKPSGLPTLRCNKRRAHMNRFVQQLNGTSVLSRLSCNTKSISILEEKSFAGLYFQPIKSVPARIFEMVFRVCALVFTKYKRGLMPMRNAFETDHFNYFRMSRTRFDHLLSLVGQSISHGDNHRIPIAPTERLAVTLR